VKQHFVGRVVVVSGAPGELGRSLVLGYAREGAEVALIDIEPQGPQETAAMFAELGAAHS
jgi:meso-butanediol dehydrogenase/(S,S)-butanediol dehydrogenase/diacetyl reductase